MSTQSFSNVSVSSNLAVLGTTAMQVITATSATITGAISAASATLSSGLTAVTGTFSGLLTANAGLVVNGASNLNGPTSTRDITVPFGFYLTNNGVTTLNNTVNLSGVIIANGATISPAELSMLDGAATNIHSRCTAIETINTTQAGQISTLQAKTANIGAAGSTTIISGFLSTDNILGTNLTGTFTTNSTGTVTADEIGTLQGCSTNIASRFGTLEGKTQDQSFASNTTTFAHNVAVNGTLATGQVTTNQLASLATSANTVSTPTVTANPVTTATTVATITVPAGQSWPLFVSCPVSYRCFMGGAQNGTFSMAVSSFTCTVYRQIGGVGGTSVHATPTVTSLTHATPRTILVSATGTIICSQNATQIDLSFTPATSATADVYTVVMTAVSPTLVAVSPAVASTVWSVVYNSATREIATSGTAAQNYGDFAQGWRLGGVTDSPPYDRTGSILARLLQCEKLLARVGQVDPLWDSQWFHVVPNYVLDLTHNLGFTLDNLPRIQVLASNTFQPTLGTHEIQDITGWCNGYQYREGYFLRHKSGNVLCISMGSDNVMHTDVQLGFGAVVNAFYRVKIWAW